MEILNSGKFTLFSALITILLCCAVAAKKKDGPKPDWAKKDIRDYSDADLERLLDQWEVSQRCLTSFYRQLFNLAIGR
jgi:Chaperone for wingless signalling and trafficking of LDL receptor